MSGGAAQPDIRPARHYANYLVHVLGNEVGQGALQEADRRLKVGACQQRRLGPRERGQRHGKEGPHALRQQQVCARPPG